MLASRSRPARRSCFQFRPLVEPLEGRLLMAGLDVPQLSSRAGAAATIYLDFDGHFESSWKTFLNVNSPAYSRDSDLTTFSASELNSINEIWTRVAEDFAPFNINVTTVVPASFDHGKTLTIVIGGSSSDWYGTQVNGVSFVGSFTSSDPNVAYVFSNNLGTGFPRWVADQASHEAGHCFGLLHQSTWSGNVLQADLSSGSGGWTPIMGSSLFSNRTTWYNGTTNVSPTSFQDDMAIIGGSVNGFGYVTDDYPDTLATATQLPITGSSVNLSGLIGQTGDQDVFKFTTAGGNLSFNLAVSAFGADLDSVLELRDANGVVVKIANDATSGVFSSALSANVAAGTYYLIVRSSGGYGNVGQYTLTGTVVPGIVTAPEISVLLNGSNLASGGSVNFGSTLIGTPVTQTFTVQNLGNGDLTLSSLDGSAFPAGFSLLTNLTSTTLAPGQSTSFSVQLDATAAGTFGGVLHLLSNDADEGIFNIVFSGTVTQPIVTAPEIRVWGNGVELDSGDTVSLGKTLVGMPVRETFTVQNVGDGNLLLSPIDATTLPAGFWLVQGLGATTLHPTDFTTFIVEFDAAFHGTFGGVLSILSNDADEGSFNINLSAAATSPDIRVFEGGADLASGDTVSFGSTPVGTPVARTFTIQNAGDGNLLVSGFDSSSLPVGYSLIAGYGTTTVAPGFSIILTLQLDAAVAGSFGGTIHILSSDGDEGSFDVVLNGVVTAPEISVFADGVELQSGDGLNFGTTLVDSPVTRTITIQNVGNSDLNLTPLDTNTFPAGFTLLNNVGATTLAPGATTTFTVQLDAAAVGVVGGTISVFNSDADEGSFSIVLTAAVTAPEISVLVDGAELQSGDAINFGTTLVGSPVTRTITIQNVGNGDLILTPVDANSLPTGFTFVNNLGATTLAPGETTTFTVQLDATAVGAFGGTIHVFNSDSDEGSFDLALSSVVTAPEISVFNGSTELSSGGTIDFGTTQSGSPVTRTITVTNAGNATLVLSPIDPSTLPAGFSLLSNFSITTLAPGGSTTFSVKLDAAVAGSLTGVIHLVSNDSDESSFDIVLVGVINDPPSVAYVKTIDNGADGFATTGKWHIQSSKNGFEKDIQFANKAEKNDKTAATATWTFTGLAAGQYRVSVTSPASPSYASDAPFSVFDGATLLSTVRVSEKKVAGDLAADGFRWQGLGVFTIQGGTLVVQLTNRANGHVAADAVRVERVATTTDPGTPTPTTPPPSSKPHDDKPTQPPQSNGSAHKPAPPPKPAPHPTVPTPAKKSTAKPSPKEDKLPSHKNLAGNVGLHQPSKPRK